MVKDAIEFFLSRFNLTPEDLNKLLAEALSSGGDYADLYFEYQQGNRVSLEEHIIKSASQSISQGVGVRVNVGDKTGYAYTDDISFESIRRAAQTAACIVQENGNTKSINVSAKKNDKDLYSMAESMNDIPIKSKIDLIEAIDGKAHSYDKRIAKVQVGFVDQYKIVMIATSEGLLAGDVQPLMRIGVQCVAEQDGNLQSGSFGGGGRCGMELFESKLTSDYMASEAARQAILQLDAVDAPAGPMEVVLGPGWPGILLHEAIGHGLEADFNRKKTSAFSEMMGKRVAADFCTVIDDGTIPQRRGSLNIDDEGNSTSRTVLIENGILCNYMNDRLNAKLLGVPLTGNGRRESYQHIPMPRMTNTFMLPGNESSEDILRSVKRGLYAVQFGGGQVDITNGKFVFSASEAYLIENGKVTAPVKGAMIIGNGPDVLTKVTAVGNDLALDHGVGTCGKDGQSVPVGVGLPTIKISEITVGGTAQG